MRRLLLLTFLLCSCATAPRPPAEQLVVDAPASPSAVPTARKPTPPALPLCCESFDQIEQLDGTKVLLEGVYKPVILSKRPSRDPQPEPPPGVPAIVSIEPPSRYSVMLGIYHAPSGPRPAEEVDRLRGKNVRVIGTLHTFTPSQVAPSGEVMQTMIGPYIDQIESIEEAR